MENILVTALFSGLFYLLGVWTTYPIISRYTKELEKENSELRKMI